MSEEKLGASHIAKVVQVYGLNSSGQPVLLKVNDDGTLVQGTGGSLVEGVAQRIDEFAQLVGLNSAGQPILVHVNNDGTISGGGSGVSQFRNLTDVAFGTPTDGQIFKYDLATDKLVPVNMPAGGGVYDGVQVGPSLLNNPDNQGFGPTVGDWTFSGAGSIAIVDDASDYYIYQSDTLATFRGASLHEITVTGAGTATLIPSTPIPLVQGRLYRCVMAVAMPYGNHSNLTFIDIDGSEGGDPTISSLAGDGNSKYAVASMLLGPVAADHTNIKIKVITPTGEICRILYINIEEVLAVTPITTPLWVAGGTSVRLTNAGITIHAEIDSFVGVQLGSNNGLALYGAPAGSAAPGIVVYSNEGNNVAFQVTNGGGVINNDALAAFDAAGLKRNARPTIGTQVGTVSVTDFNNLITALKALGLVV